MNEQAEERGSLLDDLGETMEELEEAPGKVTLLEAAKGLGSSPSDEMLKREAMLLPPNDNLKLLLKTYPENLIKA
jgi:hypothetical protein